MRVLLAGLLLAVLGTALVWATSAAAMPPAPWLLPTLRAQTQTAAARLAVVPPTPAAGCDQFMPEGRGLVRFVTDAPLLWAPDAQAVTGLAVRAGQTARWVQVDGAYVAIVWACDVLWVRLSDGVIEQ